MDNPEKKEEYGLGAIQVRVMPDNNAGNPPDIKEAAKAPVSSPTVTTAQPNASILGQRLAAQRKSSKKSVKKTIALITAVLLLVIIGGGAYWYYAYGQTMLLARQMFVKAHLPYANLKSDFDFSADMKFKRASDENNPVDMFLPSAESIKFTLKGTQHLLGNDFDGNLQFSVNAAMDSFKMENGVAYKQIGKDVYFKFDKALPTEFLGDYIDLSEFFVTDRWLSWNWDDLEKVNKNNFLMVNTDNFKLEKMKKDREKIDLYFKEFRLYKIFKIVDTKESKDTKDGKLKKLQFFVQPSQTNELLAMLAIFNPDYVNNEELKTGQDIKKKILKDLAESRNENAENLGKVEEFIRNLDIYVWVNTKTKDIQGIDLVADGDVLDIDGDKTVISGHYRFLNEAEDGHVISKPENTISVQQAYQNTMNKMEEKRMEMYRQYEEQNSKDTDNDGLSDVMESYYGTNPNKADSDGDGFKDGEEVDNGYNPLGPGKLDLNKLRS